MSGLTDARPDAGASAGTETDAETGRRMDRMYRLTRHVYDASRKYYLLGRDRLISELEPKAGETVCEVGCGTARNLVKMAQAYPQTRFCGLDASAEMLLTAAAALKRAGLEGKIALARAYAQSFTPAEAFGLDAPPDRIVFSYSLSMIPPWRASLDHALTLLKPGGEIHIVDFGGQDGLPRWFRAFLFQWLALFGVHYRPELLAYLRELEGKGLVDLRLTPLYQGYAFLARLQKL